MSWLVPFLYALFAGGNLSYGLIALAGIIVLHLASNLFDDLIDYLRAFWAVKTGKQQTFNFQKGKCCCIFENKITFKQAVFIDCILFAASLLTGVFFFGIYGIELLYIIIPAGILCLLYPVLGRLGFSEIIIAVIFSPLLYSGVYFVMTGSFSLNLLLLSIAAGLVTIGVLVNHSLLDYRYDTADRKITLCSISGSEKNALLLLAFLTSGAYISLLIFVLKGIFPPVYLLPFITLPFWLKLVKKMNSYIKEAHAPENAEKFLEKFLYAQNLQKYFITALCFSIILSGWFKD